MANIGRLTSGFTSQLRKLNGKKGSTIADNAAGTTSGSNPSLPDGPSPSNSLDNDEK